MAIEFALIPDGLPKILMTPDIKKIMEFSNGNLGISDSIKKNFNLKALSSIKDLEALKTYVDKGGVKLTNDFSSYVSNNKLKISLSDIDFNPSQNYNGLKSLEIATIKSIFETQKPYMEIIALTTKSLVDIEDIIARLLGLADKSLKPKYNPKALGFQSKLFKSDLNKLQNMNKPKSGNSSGGSNNGTNINGESTLGISVSTTTEYQIISTEYSTGEKKDNINYEFIYKDIKEDILSLDESEILDTYIEKKPKNIVFGIATQSGVPFNPPEWLSNSGKWYGQFNQLSGFGYIWKRGGETVVSGGEPNPDNYGFGWQNTEEKVFNSNDALSFTNYFNYKLEDRLINSDISEVDKIEVRTVVNNAVDPQGQLVSISDGGFLSEFNPRIFNGVNPSYLPGSLSFDNKNIWIDPESDYDLKVIKIDSTLDIAFFDAIGNRIETKIQRFLQNTAEISYTDNAPFDIDINGFTGQDIFNGLSGSNVIGSQSQYIGVTTVSYDNLTNNQSYSPNIIRRINPSDFTPIFWADNINDYDINLPNFYKKGPIVALTQSGTQSSSNTSTNTIADTNNLFNYIYKSGENWIYGQFDKSKNTQLVSYNNMIINKPEISKSVKDGRYTIPKYGDIIVKDGYIYGWSCKLETFTIKDNRKISISISSENIPTINELILEEGSIRVDSKDDRFGLIINAKQIKNEHLQISETYETDKLKYGTQHITQLFRYRTSIIDIDTYYLIEGFDLESYLDGLENSGNGNISQSTGNGYYKKRHALGAPGKFVSILINIMVKLIPKIKQLLDLFKDPAGFITAPIIEKLKDSFEIFDEDIMKDFNAAKGLSNPKEKFDQVKNNYQLFKYADVDEKTGTIRHILDGRATIKLFGIEFGLELKELILKLIFKNSNKDILDKYKTIFDNHGLNGNKDINSLLDLGPSKSETITNTYNGITTREEVDIIYSTGTKKDGVDYKYIYVTQYIQDLLNKYDELYDSGDFDGALDVLELAQQADPKNEFIRNLIDKLRQKLQSLLNPLLKLILELVTLPVKLIKGIIEFIMDLFKSLNIGNVASKIKEFVTFQWLLKLMSADTILGFIGLKMDMALLNEWKMNYKSYPNDFVFDLSKVLSIPLFAKLPKVNKDTFPHMMNLLCDTVNSILLLLQGIINSIIDLIWSLISLDAIIPPPHLNITIPCAKNNKYTISQLFDLLNATKSNNTLNDNNLNNTNGLLDFLYDIKLPDGRSIQDLDRNKLEDFVKQNGDLEFVFSF